MVSNLWKREWETELEAGKAKCDHCQAEKSVAMGGIGAFLFRAPSGKAVGRWLCRWPCADEWEAKLQTWLAEREKSTTGQP